MSFTHGSDSLRVFETLPGKYLILSVEFNILTASNDYCESVIKQRSEMVGKYVFDVFPIRYNEPKEIRVDYSLSQVIETGKPHYSPIIRFDKPNMDKKSSPSYWRSSNHPVFNNEGELHYIIHQVEDISEQIVAEEKLKESLNNQIELAAKSSQLSKRLEKILSEIPARMATLAGPDLVYEYINSRYSTIFEGRDVLGKPILEALPELKGHHLIDQLRKVYETGVTYEGNEICVPLALQKGGPLVDSYFNLVYQARYDEHGKINGILSFAYDITELVNARKTRENLNVVLDEQVKLRTKELMLAQVESERQRERLSRFFMQAPAGICILDGPDFEFDLVNPHFQELFPHRKLVGKKLIEALPELVDTPFLKMIEKAYTSGEAFEGHEMLIPIARTVNGPVEERYFNFIHQARHNNEGDADGLMIFAFEVTEIVLNRVRERERENRFKFLLNAIPQQVWTAKPDGNLDYVNEVVAQDFGRSMLDIIGSGWQSFIHPADLQSCLAHWADALTHGSEYVVEFRLLFADGSYKWHLARAVPLVEQGKITLWLGTNTNIDFQKTNEQKKDEFLSIASHELKTPLTSIKAFNQLLLRADDVGSMQGHLKKSSENILRLEKLIDDLLDVTKITAGKMQYSMEEFQFDQMVEDVISGIKLIAIHHELILESNEPTSFYGDRFRLEQVLNNFLNNAIKYSPNGKKIVVNSRVEQDNLIVSIQDFGIGIAKHEINRLFERYYRVDNTAMRFEGLGLGLFIASEILKRHKGNFWIESDEGIGSTFFFRLPISNDDLSPIKDKLDYYQDESVIILYNERLKRLELDWLGHQNIKTVKQGCLKTLEMILRFKVTKILNNNSNVVGSWSDASEWVGNIFFPMMEKKGVHSVAWIYSPNAFSQLSANKSVDEAMGNITTQFFTTLEEADSWLNIR